MGGRKGVTIRAIRKQLAKKRIYVGLFVLKKVIMRMVSQGVVKVMVNARRVKLTGKKLPKPGLPYFQKVALAKKRAAARKAAKKNAARKAKRAAAKKAAKKSKAPKKAKKSRKARKSAKKAKAPKKAKKAKAPKKAKKSVRKSKRISSKTTIRSLIKMVR